MHQPVDPGDIPHKRFLTRQVAFYDLAPTHLTLYIATNADYYGLNWHVIAYHYPTQPCANYYVWENRFEPYTSMPT